MNEENETPMSALKMHTRALRECDKLKRAALNDSDDCARGAAALRRLHGDDVPPTAAVALDELRKGARAFYDRAEACTTSAAQLREEWETRE